MEKRRTNEWVELVFEGLDTVAEIELNGKFLAKTENMFHPHSFEVTANLKNGKNHLKIHFPAHHKTIEGFPLDQYISVFAADRVFTRKMQCSFGWDWVPRLVSVGPWRPVKLIRYSHAKIKSHHFRSVDLTDKQVKILCSVQVEKNQSQATKGILKIKDPQGLKVLLLKGVERKGVIDFEGTIQNPQRWWPHGHGDPSLYSCEIQLLNADGKVLDRRIFKRGFRTIEIEELPDQRGSTFTIKINGRRIFAKGGNWVPADPFPSAVTPQKYQHLLTLAQESGCNMIRAWGGGIYEQEPFWEACDQLGLMVSQDFLFGCAVYPERDLAFRRQLEIEFRWAIEHLRDHASLILWCGDNEGGLNHSDEGDFPGRIISREITEPLCKFLDPDRPFVPTSPFRGKPTNNSEDVGDCHRTMWWDESFLISDMRDYRERAHALQGRFYSESATMGSVSYRTLLKFMSPGDVDDPSATILKIHTRNCLYGPSQIDPSLHFLSSLEKGATLLYGGEKKRSDLIPKMAYLQYEMNRLTIESLRKRLWDCSGILFWMFNDCWPALGWSAVDYYGIPKAGWYGMKSAFRPVVVSLERKGNQIFVFLSNDRNETYTGDLWVRLQPFSGKATWTKKISCTLDPLTSKPVLLFSEKEVPLTNQNVLVVDWVSKKSYDRALYFAGMPKEAQFQEAGLTSSLVNRKGENFIEISSQNYARVVTLEGDAAFEDNYFDLLPGEKRMIRYRRIGKSKEKIQISCWNQRKRE